jgi:hypothetical protein
LAREVSDLRFEGAHEVGSRVDDCSAKPFDRVGSPVEWGWHPGWIRVEADTEHR